MFVSGSQHTLTFEGFEAFEVFVESLDSQEMKAQRDAQKASEQLKLIALWLLAIRLEHAQGSSK